MNTATATESRLSVTTERVGRRTYIRGATYPIRDALRSAGAHWDAAEKAWWLGDDEKARAIAARHAVPVVDALPTATPAAMARMVLVTGNTYPVKDQLRALGGRWNSDAKGWEVPADREAEAKALVAGAPAPAKQQRTYAVKSGWRPCGYPGCSPSYCDECDGEGYRSGGGGRRWRR